MTWEHLKQTCLAYSLMGIHSELEEFVVVRNLLDWQRIENLLRDIIAVSLTPHRHTGLVPIFSKSLNLRNLSTYVTKGMRHKNDGAMLSLFINLSLSSALFSKHFATTPK